MRDFFYLMLAAFLEVGGDALIRFGLRGGRWIGLAAGAAVLFAYGLSVNLPKWNFSRLMGVYIALFFVVSQLLSVVVFKEKVQLPTLIGGVLIVTGGVLMTSWRVPEEIPKASLNADRPVVQSSE
jgi:small multidrug resistance family-3 protein